LQWRGNLKCINNAKNIAVLHDDENTARMTARWLNDFLRATNLQWLQDTNYNVIDHILCFSFVERWHEETSSFHLGRWQWHLMMCLVWCISPSRACYWTTMVQFPGLMLIWWCSCWGLMWPRPRSKWKRQMVSMHVLDGWQIFSMSVFGRRIRLRWLVI